MRKAIMKCNCYVKTLTDYHQFSLRYGAHEPQCPVYRLSGDLVDKMHDAAARKHFTGKA